METADPQEMWQGVPVSLQQLRKRERVRGSAIPSILHTMAAGEEQLRSCVSLSPALSLAASRQYWDRFRSACLGQLRSLKAGLQVSLILLQDDCVREELGQACGHSLKYEAETLSVSNNPAPPKSSTEARCSHFLGKGCTFGIPTSMLVPRKWHIPNRRPPYGSKVSQKSASKLLRCDRTFRRKPSKREET